MDEDSFNQAVSMLPAWLREPLGRLPAIITQNVSEIRLRAGLPAAVCVRGKTHFISRNEGIDSAESNALITTQKQIEEILAKLCEFSVYSFSEELANGYVTVRGGHRVGVCGTYSESKGVGRFTSLNIRIAKQHFGCADELIKIFGFRRPESLLIAGPPASGKTTVLRELSRVLASSPRFFKLAIIDERGEIAATYRGQRGCDVGVTSDVLDGYPRARGFEAAVRSLSPEMIICDEIGSAKDAEALEAASLSGVSVAASVHARSRDELRKNKVVSGLIENGVIRLVCMLKGENSPGKTAWTNGADERL